MSHATVLVLLATAHALMLAQTTPVVATIFERQVETRPDGTTKIIEKSGQYLRSANGSYAEKLTVRAEGLADLSKEMLYNSRTGWVVELDRVNRVAKVRAHEWRPAFDPMPKKTDLADPKRISGLVCHAYPFYGQGRMGNGERIGVVWTAVDQKLVVRMELQWTQKQSGSRFNYEKELRDVTEQEPPADTFEIPKGFQVVSSMPKKHH